MPTNHAAWLMAAKTKSLEVKAAPYTSPAAEEIVIKTAAVAINPVDVALQAMAIFPLTYPSILGEGLAGEVVEVGSSVSRFRTGDRVLALASGSSRDKPAQSAFQEYTVVPAVMVAGIPDSLAFERAAVLPLALGTAASGMFGKGSLRLQFPSTNPTKATTTTGKALLVWGGASSVGSNAIQLGVAAGYEIITTASPKNFEYVTKLGASRVFDYRRPGVTDELIDAFRGKDLAGAIDCIGFGGSLERCCDFLARCDGDGDGDGNGDGNGGNKFLAAARMPPENMPAGVTAQFIKECEPDVAEVVFGDFLPAALAAGTYVAAPDALVVGKGLGFVQQALDAYGKGLSAKKLVVTF